MDSGAARNGPAKWSDGAGGWANLNFWSDSADSARGETCSLYALRDRARREGLETGGRSP